MATRLRHRLAAAAPLAAAVAFACATPDLEGPAPEAAEVGRIARIHLVLQPAPDPLGVDPQLDLRARFAAYRGLDADLARARIGLAPLPHARVGAGSCMPSDHLDVEPSDRALGDDPELLLVDGGDLRLRVADLDLDVPLVLVPGLLPYMSGVEYALVRDHLPTTFVPGERPAVALDLAGRGDDELPALRLRARLPPPIDLRAELTLDPSLIDLRWRPAPVPGAPLLVRLGAYVGGEAIGHEVTCAFVDRGELRLDLAELRRLGLGGAGEGLKITASRADVAAFEVGEFSAGELIIELREAAFITLP